MIILSCCLRVNVEQMGSKRKKNIRPNTQCPAQHEQVRIRLYTIHTDQETTRKDYMREMAEWIRVKFFTFHFCG